MNAKRRIRFWNKPCLQALACTCLLARFHPAVCAQEMRALDDPSHAPVVNRWYNPGASAMYSSEIPSPAVSASRPSLQSLPSNDHLHFAATYLREQRFKQFQSAARAQPGLPTDSSWNTLSRPSLTPALRSSLGSPATQMSLSSRWPSAVSTASHPSAYGATRTLTSRHTLLNGHGTSDRMGYKTPTTTSVYGPHSADAFARKAQADR